MRPVPEPCPPQPVRLVCPVCGREPFFHVFVSRGGAVLGCDWCVQEEEREVLLHETGISV